MWTARQRRVVVTLSVGLLVYLTARVVTHRTFIPTEQPAEGVRASELADKLDPNTATVEEIAAIPNVGRSLAGAIVSYRVSARAQRTDRPAFSEPRDLLRVKGIGAARMEGMQPYLAFPEPGAAAGH